MTLQPVWSEKESFKGRWFHISGVWTLSCGCQFWLYTNGQKLVLRPNVTNCKTAWETYSLAGWPILAETWGWAVPCLITQSCPTVCDPLDCSPQGSSVHGILQARILEWVAIFLLQGIFLTQGSNPHLLCLLHWQAGSLPLSYLGILTRFPLPYFLSPLCVSPSKQMFCFPSLSPL